MTAKRDEGQMTKPINLLIADDHAVLRHGLRLILDSEADITVVGEATNGQEAVTQALALQPEVVLMDMSMPELSGIEATRRIKAQDSNIRVLMLTVSSNDKDLIEAVKAGARGYLLKNSESGEVIDAIRRIAAGETVLPPDIVTRVLDELADPASAPQPLTKREIGVLKLIARGMGNKEIAVDLHISENTVKTHVRHILEKLGLNNRAEAAAYAVRAGLLPEG